MCDRKASILICILMVITICSCTDPEWEPRKITYVGGACASNPEKPGLSFDYASQANNAVGAAKKKISGSVSGSALLLREFRLATGGSDYANSYAIKVDGDSTSYVFVAKLVYPARTIHVVYHY